MIRPRTLADMIEAGRLQAVQGAIVAGLKALLPDVTVVAHPGKLDINDVVARKVVAVPGVAVGWTAIRYLPRPGGTFDLAVDWAAYVVVEDRADLSAKRATPREAVGHAIGGFLLEILADPDAASWNRRDLDEPAQEPGPQLVPMFTARSFEAGTAYYAVTWRQAILDVGTPMFDAGRIALRVGEDGFGEAEFDEGGGIPTEILAIMREAEGGQS